MKNNQAFTLMELLIVVIIIGILAAIAVPQYQKARDRALYTQMIAAAQTLADAQQRYISVNGEPSRDIDSLDISFTGPRINNFSAINNCGGGTLPTPSRSNSVVDMGNFELGIGGYLGNARLAIAFLKGDKCRALFIPFYNPILRKDNGTSTEIPIQPLCYVGNNGEGNIWARTDWCSKTFGSNRGEGRVQVKDVTTTGIILTMKHL